MISVPVSRQDVRQALQFRSRQKADSSREGFMENKIYTSNRSLGFVLIPFGAIMLIFAVAVPFFLKSRLLAFILMGIPMAFSGLVILMQGISSAKTLIEITTDELKMVFPGWRCCPVPPMRRISLGWNEIQAVRSRIEVFNVLVPPALILPYSVYVYAIDSNNSRFVLPARVVRNLHDAIREISTRSGRPVVQEREITVKLFRCLIHGAPEWPSLAKHAPSS